jgi:hypothetical protein
MLPTWIKGARWAPGRGRDFPFAPIDSGGLQLCCEKRSKKQIYCTALRVIDNQWNEPSYLFSIDSTKAGDCPLNRYRP